MVGGHVEGLLPGAWSDNSQITTPVNAALVQAPAVLTLTAFVVAAFGLRPRHTDTVAWTTLAVAVILGSLGTSSTFRNPPATSPTQPHSGPTRRRVRHTPSFLCSPSPFFSP